MKYSKNTSIEPLAIAGGYETNNDNLSADNTAEIKFITKNGQMLSSDLYDTATIKVKMGRFVPTKKFLNEVADTLAADMIDYLKSGGRAESLTAKDVYEDSPEAIPNQKPIQVQNTSKNLNMEQSNHESKL